MLIAIRTDRANRRRTLVVAGLAAAAALLATVTASPAAAADHCADHLVTHAPEGSQGDASAVAITSQAIDEDQPGWIRVSWSAAAGTELTAVIAQTVDEETVALAPDADGFAEDVRSLTFCGSVADQAEDDAAGEDGAGDDQDGDTEVEVEPDEGASDGDADGDGGATGDDGSDAGTDDAGTNAGTDTSTDTQPTDVDDAADDTGADGAAADASDDGDGDDATTPAYTVEAQLPEEDLRDDPEVQVLSVTMSRDDDEADATAAAAPTDDPGAGLFGPAAGALMLGVLLALGALTVADWRRVHRNHGESR